MADVKNNKLSSAASPVPSSKSPIPEIDSEEADPPLDGSEMEEDPDVNAKVTICGYKS